MKHRMVILPPSFIIEDWEIIHDHSPNTTCWRCAGPKNYYEELEAYRIGMLAGEPVFDPPDEP